MKKTTTDVLKHRLHLILTCFFCFFLFLSAGAQTISGSDTNPNDMGNDVLPASYNQRVLRVIISSTGTATSPQTITQLVVNLGTTTNAASIKSANIYLIDQWGNTDFSSPFSTASVSGGKLTFTGSYAMTEVKDYRMDVCYNIADEVTDGDKVDAAIESATIDGVAFVATAANGTNQRTIKNQGLTGTITVDKNAAALAKTSYTDFRTMLNDLNTYGVGAGGATIVVADDQTFSYTNGWGTDLTIEQTGRPGAPLVIKRSGGGTSAPVIEKQRGGSYFSYLLVIKGARYLTLDGLSFKGTAGDGDSKYFTGLTFTSGDNQTVENIEIKNCTVNLDMLADITDNQSRFGGVGVRISDSNENPSNGAMNTIKIHHNQFLNLRDGVTLARRSGRMENIEINNNTVSNFINVGINVNGINNPKDFEGPVSIHDNNLLGTTIDIAGEWGGSRDYRGIYVNKSIGNVSIYNNKVHGMTNLNALSRVMGISAQGNHANAVTNIYNNMIWGLTAPNSTNSEACNAFILEEKGKFNVYYNTAVLDYATSSANTSRILLTYSWNTPQIELINNIFVNNVQVSGPAKAAVMDMNPSFLTAASDNNLYYAGTPGANNLINLNDNKQTLADYQAQVTGKDLNSVSGTVPFVSANDLHVLPNTGLGCNTGKPVALVTTDIDGKVRPGNPDMGAAEFNDVVSFVIPVNNITGARIYSQSGKIIADLSSVNGASIVSVIDTKGSVIKTLQSKGFELLNINIPSKGIYLVRVQNGDKLSTQKVVL